MLIPDTISIVSNSGADELITIAPRPQSQLSVVSSHAPPTPRESQKKPTTVAELCNLDTDRTTTNGDQNDMNNNNCNKVQPDSSRV